MATKKQKPEDNPDMRVLKTATCPTLSGKSKLTYHIGVSPDSEIHLRVYTNSGGGAFSREWISLEGIQTALDKRHKGQHVTAFLLQPLYKGKSVNTPGFLLSTLANEKLVRVLKGKKREHEILDPSGFIAKVEKLIASGVDVKIKEPAKTATKTASKTPIKKTPVKKTAGNTVKKASVKKTITKSTGAPTKKAAIKKRSVSKRMPRKTG
jgi:hypothetical protein